VDVRRLISRLTELQVRRAGRGWHNDGGGLYLRVLDSRRRWWVFRYGPQGRRYHGLGPAHTVGLAEAREQARRCRKLLLEGTDPISAGKVQRAAVQLAAANAKTFAECAEAYHEAHRIAWKNPKHVREWRSSLAIHVFPLIGALPVAAIDTGHVLRVLEPVWSKIPETASRLRSRIEAVLDWAKVRGLRDGENPARWRGHLDHLLPALKKAARVRHHAALHYRDIPLLMEKLRQCDGVEARALEFLTLTAARAGEACSAVWDEIDLVDQVWAIPAARMKSGKEHRVPLARAARVGLERTPPDHRQGWICPGARAGRPVSVISLWRLAQEVTGGATTVHGLRSSFRDWCAEQTNFPREIAEQALAHVVGSDVELAYRRSDLLQKRHQLMEAWGRYCTSGPTTSEVVPIRRRRRG
jgi:integrase